MQTIPWHPTKPDADGKRKAMMFRRKLLVVFALTVFLSVAAVALLVSAVTRRAFERSEDERTAALVTQFRREFNRQGDDVARRVEVIAASEDASRMAAKLNRPQADAGPYFELAKTTAEHNGLDFLEFVESDGTIISSAQWPAKFGYADNGVGSFAASGDQGAFLKQEELQDGAALGLFAVRATRVGERPVYVIGGRRLECELCCIRIAVGGLRQSCWWIRLSLPPRLGGRSRSWNLWSMRCGGPRKKRPAWCIGRGIKRRMRCFMQFRC